jgi:hypothetical protein
VASLLLAMISVRLLPALDLRISTGFGLMAYAPSQYAFRESLRRLPVKEILAAARPTLDEHVEQGIAPTSF